MGFNSEFKGLKVGDTDSDSNFAYFCEHGTETPNTIKLKNFFAIREIITSQGVPTKLVIQDVAAEIHHTSGKHSLD